MNRIQNLFTKKEKNILSVYFTAGYPTLDSMPGILKSLAGAGADMIEIGMPFSDPMADGPVIQASSSAALKNGMNLRLLLKQLAEVRPHVEVPVLLMGYLNPVLQYGMEAFCSDCSKAGVDGIILPDLPLEVYVSSYKKLFEESGLNHVFLVSPQTTTGRLAAIDRAASGFLYFVSSSSTTGMKNGFGPEHIRYFERIKSLELKNPAMIGFGISGNESFKTVCRYARGAIIGSAFVNMLSASSNPEKDIQRFISDIRH